MIEYVQSFFTRHALGQLGKLAIIGLVNTAVDFALFNVFRFQFDWPLAVAVSVAFVLATFVSYVLNRRWTFQLKDRWFKAGETGMFLIVNAVALAVTNGIVLGADAWFGPLGPIGANAAKVVAAAIILLPKFAGYRDVVFRRAVARAPRN